MKTEAKIAALKELAESDQGKMFNPAVYLGAERFRGTIRVNEWLNEEATKIAHKTGS